MRSCFVLSWLAAGALADILPNGYNNAQQSSYVPCNQQSTDQCATSCNCMRVACCCGPNCDKVGGQVNYNRCVNAGSDSSTWNCPSTSTCTAYGGREMTTAPCLSGGSTGNPSSNNGNGPASSEFAFGTTFPMLGTKAISSSQTWDGSIYQGTIQQFNPGATFSYTDQFWAPITSTAKYDSSTGNMISSGLPGNNGQPTPAPDYTGVPCSLANQCPTGYYCQVNTGSNIQQKGFCSSVPSNFWNGGAGQFTSSNFYNSWVHPPLITDPNHNGPPAPAPGYNSGYNYNSGYGASSEYNGGSGYNSGSGYNNGGSSYNNGGSSYNNGGSSYNNGGSSYNNGGSSYDNGGFPTGGSSSYVPGGANSCAQPSVCGYKSASGNCWCDGECQSTGDCCSDISQYCSYSGLTPAAPAPSPSSGNCLQDNNQCSARGGCGTTNTQPVNIGSQVCYCDASCHQYNDCCCSAC